MVGESGLEREEIRRRWGIEQQEDVRAAEAGGAELLRATYKPHLTLCNSSLPAFSPPCTARAALGIPPTPPLELTVVSDSVAFFSIEL